MLHSIQAFKRRLELNVISRGLNDRPSALLQRNGRGHSDGEGQHGLHEARHQQGRKKVPFFKESNRVFFAGSPYQRRVYRGMSQ